MTGDYYQLQPGATLGCSAGDVKVIEYIASGGQGEVYLVELNGSRYAMKYYYDDPRLCNPALKEDLEYIIENPIESSAFVWPLYLVENGNQFGYVMKLIDSGYYPIRARIGGDIEISYDILFKVCISLCAAYRELYSAGYCYKDISSENVLFNPDNGDVLIIDNDNVTPNQKPSTVKGTSKFLAPELIDGGAPWPTLRTDLHSLAVLLFQMLFVEHPLNGKKEYYMSVLKRNDTEFFKELYGSDTACFIFKDENDLDRYIATEEPAHINARNLWMVYPGFIKDMFTRAFVRGIKNPHSRPQAFEWMEAFSKLLSILYECPHCGDVYFYDGTKRDWAVTCDRCGEQFKLARIKAQDNVIPITDKKVLYACYFNSAAKDKLEPILEAEFSRGALRFENVSDHSVVCHSIGVGKGEKTDYIRTPHFVDNTKFIPDFIVVDGKKYSIAL